MSDRDAPKRRRQARNRQQREALAARRSAAARRESTKSTAEPPANPSRSPVRGVRRRASVASPPAGETAAGRRSGRPAPGPTRAPSRAPSKAAGNRAATSAGSGAGPEVGSGAGPEAGNRVARAHRVAEATAARREAGGLGGMVADLRSKPGGSWVGLAFVGALVAFVAAAAFPVFPRPVLPLATKAAIQQRQSGLDAAAKTNGTKATKLAVPKVRYEQVRLRELLPPWSLALFGLPLLLIGFAVLSSRNNPDPSKIWMWCALGVGVVFVLYGVILTFLMPAVAAMGFGAFKARKASRMAAGDQRPVRGRAGRANRRTDRDLDQADLDQADLDQADLDADEIDESDYDELDDEGDDRDGRDGRPPRGGGLLAGLAGFSARRRGSGRSEGGTGSRGDGGSSGGS
ncbi:MAG: hypothetical protein HYX34_13255 [Actinobacteria bacterium]|nr:hypothetical protein [Actinomycetota bacterium]